MFKCHNFYCIACLAICDGQHDCREGEDESVCPLSSCPGLLRCRGEHRCIEKNDDAMIMYIASIPQMTKWIATLEDAL